MSSIYKVGRPNVLIKNVLIKNADDLFEWFKALGSTPVYVSTMVRREWLLEHRNLLINGSFYNIQFEDQKGGVWLASLVKE